MPRPPLALFVLLALLAIWPLVRARERWARERRATWEPFAIAAGLIALAIPAGAVIGRPDFVPALLVRDDWPIGSVDAVFVASGDVDFHRTRYAADVFRASGARWFLLSGGGAGGDNAMEMAEAAALEFDVPVDALRVEEEATTTRENVVFGRDLIDEDVKTIAVVTDRLHSRRFAMAARRAWPGVRVIAATVPEDQDPLACQRRDWRDDPVCRRAVVQEWTKLAGYFLFGWL